MPEKKHCLLTAGTVLARFLREADARGLSDLDDGTKARTMTGASPLGTVGVLLAISFAVGAQVIWLTVIVPRIKGIEPHCGDD